MRRAKAEKPGCGIRLRAKCNNVAGFRITLASRIELAASYLQPATEASGTDHGPFRRAPDEIYQSVPGVVGCPTVLAWPS
jgi:hypothetical protein